MISSAPPIPPRRLPEVFIDDDSTRAPAAQQRVASTGPPESRATQTRNSGTTVSPSTRPAPHERQARRGTNMPRQSPERDRPARLTREGGAPSTPPPTS